MRKIAKALGIEDPLMVYELRAAILADELDAAAADSE
jgi:hypothetical protein